MFDFNIQAFYDALDQHYAACDNAATEAFLKAQLERVDELGILLGVGGGCPACRTEEDDQLTMQERKLLIQRSEARIAVLNETACFYRGISRFKPCIEAFEALMAEMEFCGLNGSEQYALAVINMAGVYRLLCEFDRALELFDLAQGILDQLGSSNDYGYASLYNNRGLVYQDQREWPKAAEHFEKALEYTRRVDDNEAEIATALSNIALAYHRMGNTDKARTAIEESLAIFEKIDDGKNPHYAGALNTYATFLYLAGDYARSAEHFRLAAEITKLIFGENWDYAACCRNCSMALSQLGDHENARLFAVMAEVAMS